MLEVLTRVVEPGTVRRTTVVHTRALLADAPRWHDHVASPRMPIPLLVDGPVSMGADGGLTMCAVMEAVQVVEKQRRLREAIPLHKEHSETRQPPRIT